uniref:YTH domain-containing protein n=1 Tax=Globodera pallida TaxID=36090 RepID=A0A183BQP2_GLOPA
MWPPPMRHPSQYMGGGRPPPAYPSRELLPMDYPPGPSALPLLPPPPPIGLAAANPFGADERSMPPWHRRMGGDQLLNDSWKAADSSWRQQPRQFGPYSNHEFYRQQYTQLPLSRPHANFHPPPLQHLNPPNSFATPTPNLHYAGELMPMHSFESPSGGHVAVPPEYAAARADYERRLREHCEETRKMNSASAVASNFCDFSSAANGSSENAVKAAGEGGVELLTQPSARRIRIRWTFRMPGGRVFVAI